MENHTEQLSKKKAHFLKKYVSVIASVVISFFLVFITVLGATTIGENIVTDGLIRASSTLVVTGTIDFYDDVMVNGFATTTGSNGNFATNGSLGVSSSSPSTTFGVAGSAYISTGFGVGAVNTTANTIAVATSTPAQELSVEGDGYFSSDATTTLSIKSTGTNIGSCIEMIGSDGNTFRIYAGATTTEHNALIVEQGQCQ